MPELVIHTEDLRRTFGALTALDGLSMEVSAGIVFPRSPVGKPLCQTMCRWR